MATIPRDLLPQAFSFLSGEELSTVKQACREWNQESKFPEPEILKKNFVTQFGALATQELVLTTAQLKERVTYYSHMEKVKKCRRDDLTLSYFLFPYFIPNVVLDDQGFPIENPFPEDLLSPIFSHRSYNTMQRLETLLQSSRVEHHLVLEDFNRSLPLSESQTKRLQNLEEQIACLEIFFRDSKIVFALEQKSRQALFWSLALFTLVLILSLLLTSVHMHSINFVHAHNS